MNINVSGAHGVDGSRGGSGSFPGGRGGDGRDGTSGVHAGKIDIVLEGTDSSCVVKGTHQGVVGYSRNAAVHMQAVGGKGGHGGDGGSGGSGSSGAPGMNATQYSSGTNGGPGGPGGDGGNGGDAGTGGDGGFVRVHASDKDMDMFMLCNRCPVNGGTKGKGGSGGSGGAGGPGGPGGAGCSYTESRYNYSTKSTEYITKYQPGGMPGPSGPSGRRGRDGRDGRDGANGSFKEVVHYEGQANGVEYSWRYVATVSNPGANGITTNDGVFEPGEECRCWYHIRNSGPMPTPKVQRILCSLFANNWVQRPTTSHVAQQLVKSGESAGLNQQIQYWLRDQPEPAPNTVFKDKTDLLWSVQVERVGKFFTPEELEVKRFLTIEWPVRLSPFHGAPTIANSEEAPLAACLHNLSTKAIGTDVGRKLRVRVSIVENANNMREGTVSPDFAYLVDREENKIPFLDCPLAELQSKDNFFPSVLVKFGSETPPHSRVTLGAQLYIGRVTDFMEERRIQRVSLDVQLSEYYFVMNQSDMLVVTNHRTTRESFMAWERLGADRCVAANFWNATLHDGLALEQEVNGGIVSADYNHRVVVVENNNPAFLSTVSNDRNRNQEHSMDTVPTGELVRAVRDSSVGFLVLGKCTPPRSRLLPVDLEPVRLPLREPSRCDGKYWLDRIRFCTFIPEEMLHEVVALHQRNAPMYGKYAWPVVWGFIVTKFGKREPPMSPISRFDFEQRLQSFFGLNLPMATVDTVAQLLKLARSGDHSPDAIMEELSKQLDCMELPFDPLYYLTVKATVRTSKMTQLKARCILSREGAKLARRVADMRPTWKFTVMYSVTPSVADGRLKLRPMYGEPTVFGIPIVQEKKMPFMKKDFVVGRLFLARSADRNGASIVNLAVNSDQGIRPGTIANLSYPLLKACPFQLKMEKLVCAQFCGSGENASMLESAIISDLVEEQIAMRRHQWNGAAATSCWLLEQCTNLTGFVAACDALSLEDNEVGYRTAMTILIRIRVLLHRWVEWKDRVMINRRNRLLSSAGIQLVDSTLRKLFGIPRDRLVGFFLLRLKKHEKETLRDLVVNWAIGGDHGASWNAMSSKNMELSYRVMDAATVLRYNAQQPPHVVVNRWQMEEPRDRKMALHKLRCDFGSEGLVAEQTTRAEQHQQHAVLGCPGKHTLSRTTCSTISTSHACSVCDDRLQEDNEIMYCRPCSWVVCMACWSRGNEVRWGTAKCI